MELPLSALLGRITYLCDYELLNTDLSASYEGIQMFDIDENRDTGLNYLYFITEKMLKNYYTRLLCEQLLTSSVFLCYSTSSDTRLKELCPDLSVIILVPKETVSFTVVFNKLLHIFHDFEYWDKALHLELLHGASIQRLLDLTEPILSHPMLVFDANLAIVGFVRKKEEADPYMEELLEVGYITPDMLRKLQNCGVMPLGVQEESMQITKYRRSDGFFCYSMWYPLNPEYRTCAYAMVFCCKSHPSDGYQYFMDMVIGNLSLYFEQERFLASASAENYEFFLVSLLSNPDTPQKQLETQLAFIPSLSMEGNFLLARVYFEGKTKPPYSFASWNLKNTFPGLKPFVYENNLYVLKSAESPLEVLNSYIPPEEETQFLDCFTGSSIWCSVSQPFFRLPALSCAAEQCSIAADFRRKEASAKLFAYFREYAFRYMQKKLAGTEVFPMVSSPYYQALQLYDREHKSDLCDVFACYLQNGKNINQTAASAFMHRNTVLNKVKKAVSIMGNDFEDYSLGFFFILNYLYEKGDDLP